MLSANHGKTVSGLKRKLAFFSELSLLGIITSVIATICVVALVYFFAIAKQAPIQQSCSVNSELGTTDITVRARRFTAEIASTVADKAQGLSNRECLDTDRAMIFPYEEAGDYCYWMKDMSFAIDMVWLDSDKKIITIVSDAKPESYPQAFCPEAPAQYVVEVNAGTAARYGWQVGDVFSF